MDIENVHDVLMAALDDIVEVTAIEALLFDEEQVMSDVPEESKDAVRSRINEIRNNLY